MQPGGEVTNVALTEHAAISWFTIPELDSPRLADPDVAVACKRADELLRPQPADEQELHGENVNGVMRVKAMVQCNAGPWTPAVHWAAALSTHVDEGHAHAWDQ